VTESLKWLSIINSEEQQTVTEYPENLLSLKVVITVLLYQVHFPYWVSKDGLNTNSFKRRIISRNNSFNSI